MPRGGARCCLLRASSQIAAVTWCAHAHNTLQQRAVDIQIHRSAKHLGFISYRHENLGRDGHGTNTTLCKRHSTTTQGVVQGLPLRNGHHGNHNTDAMLGENVRTQHAPPEPNQTTIQQSNNHIKRVAKTIIAKHAQPIAVSWHEIVCAQCVSSQKHHGSIHGGSSAVGGVAGRSCETGKPTHANKKHL